jgi:hypothetical protein
MQVISKAASTQNRFTSYREMYHWLDTVLRNKSQLLTFFLIEICM